MSYDHLPTWALTRCADCDELFLPGFGTVWSSRRPNQHTHGGLHRCKAQADWQTAHPEGLTMMLTLMEQAIVEARERLGRFVSEADEENWNDEVANAVFSASASLDRGYDARKLIAFEATEVAP